MFSGGGVPAGNLHNGAGAASTEISDLAGGTACDEALLG